jgi:hypothetical protein
MGKISKQELSSFIDFECEKKLFVELGMDDPNWMTPGQSIIPLDRKRRGSVKELITNIGKKYEQKVFKSMNRLRTKYNSSADGNITRTSFNKEKLEELYHDIVDNGSMIVFEHGIRPPTFFYQALFDPLNPNSISVENMVCSPIIYPDLLLFNQPAEDIELLADGTVARVKAGSNRVGISIIDIKSNHEENVGKKQFIEVFFYANALLAYLKENSLLSKFYVSTKRNGILPKLEDPYFNSLDELLAVIVEIDWFDSSRIYTSTTSILQKLWRSAPLNKDDVELNLNTKCGRCNNLKDCLTYLGFYNPNKSIADIRLIPYIKPAIVEQLEEKGIKTLGDLQNNIDSLKMDDLPDPLYPEIPMLKLKTSSIVSGTQQTPQQGQLFSAKLPNFIDIAIIINGELDPLTNRVFAAAFNLNVFVNDTAFHSDQFRDWLSIWKDLLDGEFDFDELIYRLEDLIDTELNVREIQEYHRILLGFQNMQPIFRPATDEQSYTLYSVAISYLNKDFEDQSEFKLAKFLVNTGHSLIRFAAITEKYVYARFQYDDKEIIYRPKSALYYWSSEILDSLEELMQRHMMTLFTDSGIQNKLGDLVVWITPKDEKVKDPDQHKKIFDLRAYVESTQGLPSIVNYTWHGFYELITGFTSHPDYYTPLFNYMDHSHWYRYVDAPERQDLLLDTKKLSKEDIESKLKDQLIHKVRALNSIRTELQKTGNDIIRSKSPPTTGDYGRAAKVPLDYHIIAKVWYQFSKLTTSIQMTEAEEYRYLFTQQAVGRLMAAKVDNLNVREFKKPSKRSASGYTYKYEYTFTISGVSRNVKFKENDMVLLIPEELRDNNRYTYNAKIKLEDLVWDNVNHRYNVRTDKIYKNLPAILNDLTGNPNSVQWYLYPHQFDAWSGKLFKLLASFNFGSSFLGHALSYMWQLSRIPPAASTDDVILNEVYMYRPQLLNYNLNQYSKITSPMKFTPDDSQSKAILNSLNHTISAIQGPPGTGKSQTITTLLDEFLINRDKPTRILITSFSYQALYVLIDKVKNSLYKDGSRSEIASLPRIFLRSGYKEDHSDAHDLVNTGGTTWHLNGKPLRGKLITELIESDNFIIFSVPHQIYKLPQRRPNGKRVVLPENFKFDIIICDEASQMPVDQFLAPMQMIGGHQLKLVLPSLNEQIRSVEELNHIKLDEIPEELTKVVLVGDFNQLPPVQNITPPKSLVNVLSSVFTYFLEHMKIPSEQLKINYRSNEVIVEYTNQLKLYDRITAFDLNAKNIIKGDTANLDPLMREIMDPNKIVTSIIHNHKHENALSELEANISVNLILSYYLMIDPQTTEQEKDFWYTHVGIVAPHNSQSRLIIQLIFRELSQNDRSKLSDNELMNALKQTIFSVEKFQGSDRNFIIATIGISSKDQLLAEEEFIYDINRFNVLTSRAKNKIVLIASRNYIDYIPKTREVMQSAARIRLFVENFCDQGKVSEVDCNEHGIENIEIRWRCEI